MATKEATTEKKSLQAKLATIQYRLECKKDSYNQFGKFSFRSAESIYECLKPLLEQEGLVAKFEEHINGGVMSCKLVIADMDGNTDETVFETYIDTDLKGMSKPQACGACASYARKYVLCSRFLIDGGDHDLDARDQTDDIMSAIPKANTLDELNALYMKQQTFFESNKQYKDVLSARKQQIIAQNQK